MITKLSLGKSEQTQKPDEVDVAETDELSYDAWEPKEDGPDLLGSTSLGAKVITDFKSIVRPEGWKPKDGILEREVVVPLWPGEIDQDSKIVDNSFLETPEGFALAETSLDIIGILDSDSVLASRQTSADENENTYLDGYKF